MSETTNAFAMAQQQFDHVADLLGLDHQVREMLRWPMREYHLRIPIPYGRWKHPCFPGLSGAA